MFNRKGMLKTGVGLLGIMAFTKMRKGLKQGQLKNFIIPYDLKYRQGNNNSKENFLKSDSHDKLKDQMDTLKKGMMEMEETLAAFKNKLDSLDNN